VTDLNAWWDRLSADDRALFTAHADTSPLPAEVVQRAHASGLPIASATWPHETGGRFDWPEWLAEFLRGKTAE
jgi:hypothetical protein